MNHRVVCAVAASVVSLGSLGVYAWKMGFRWGGKGSGKGPDEEAGKGQQADAAQNQQQQSAQSQQQQQEDDAADMQQRAVQKGKQLEQQQEGAAKEPTSAAMAQKVDTESRLSLCLLVSFCFLVLCILRVPIFSL